MNKENIRTLMDVLIDGSLTYEEEPVYFDMESWFSSSCNTLACIAGHAAILSGKNFEDEDLRDLHKNIRVIAQAWLGLDDDQARLLFVPTSDRSIDESMDLSDVTLEDAVRVLEELLETGQVNWRL